MIRLSFFFALSLLFTNSFGQQERWQQRAEYVMDIDVDVSKHQYTGKQTLTYYNNSNESLNRVFYHLYFNAFQPGSMMDVRSRTIEDPDSRVGDRIATLSKSEQGYIDVKSLKMNGEKVNFSTVGTILEVDLNKAIQPGEKVVFEMEWDAQVPLQVRRSGWNNKEGIELSMTQWYPKMCEFDIDGWHANPYVGREFYGIWGDFEVNITIDKSYTIGGTGVLQNPEKIGHGYSATKSKTSARGGKLTWKFKAENVHDFAWAADPDFVHSTAQVPNGPILHFIHQDNEEFNANWKELEEKAVKAFTYLSKNYGKYPYPQYTIIQGGDGGMEYPMTTLITGERSVRSLISVTVHEAAHSWYQGALATNEALFEWMDEGFTSFASSNTMEHLLGPNPAAPKHYYAMASYIGLARDGGENPLITHADHYVTNRAYGTAAYSKGEVFLVQLRYIIGEKAFNRGMLDYFNKWKFKHPNSTDFKRVMEKISGMELDWYFEYFVNSTHTIDYSITRVEGKKDVTSVSLERLGVMPMPIDLYVTLKNGEKHVYTIPLRVMRSEKKNNDEATSFTISEDWPWTHPEYNLELPFSVNNIESITIDEQKQMGDINRENNTILIEEGVQLIYQN